MNPLIKHIGKLINTDQRVVVAMNRIPDRRDHALVVTIDNLHDKYLDDLMTAVRGPAQKHEDAGTTLSQTRMAYTGKSILETLHLAGKLSAVPHSSIIMTPHTSHNIPLEKVLEMIEGGKPTVAPPVIEAPASIPVESPTQLSPANEAMRKARDLIATAEILEGDAAQKRETAYSLVPELRPVVASNDQPEVEAKIVEGVKKTTRKKDV